MEQTTLVEKEGKALVVLSGGQDSVTCLGVALKAHEEVEAVCFAYGQNHSVELGSAIKICKDYDVKLTILTISALGALADSALTTGQVIIGEAHPRNQNLPASFVPNRNAMFMTTAHAMAQKIGAEFVYTGVCQTDYSGYPDCRDDFISSLQDTLNLGYLTDIKFITPLMYLTKAETFNLAKEVGFLDTVLNDSHTCYNGDHDHFHEWGYGCGACPACELRKKGYYEFLEMGNNNGDS